MTLTIGVDVGGTKIAAGVVDESGKVIDEARRKTPAQETSAIVEAIVDVVHEVTARHEIAAVGVGAAGFIGADRATVLFAPNLAWRNVPLRDQLASKLDLPVIIENDVNAAAWGEFQFGAAGDAHDLLMVAVGTGVGGGIVVDGELVRGRFGIAAEIGHLRVVRGGLECGCGQHGCWEQYASGRALVRVARERALDGDALLAAANGDRANIDGQTITRLAQDGDELSTALIAELGQWLGEGIASLAAVLDPGLVVIGGGVAEAGDLLMVPLTAAFASFLPATDNRPHLEMRTATLGNKAAIIGAADLAKAAQ
ncbi:MAG: ROK family protein [Nocardioidaceae bacterium]|nr:ROK family protein [Nocardioidaceae bacterium]